MDPIDCIIVYALAAWTKEGSCTCTRTTASASRVNGNDAYWYIWLCYSNLYYFYFPSPFTSSPHLSRTILDKVDKRRYDSNWTIWIDKKRGIDYDTSNKVLWVMYGRSMRWFYHLAPLFYWEWGGEHTSNRLNTLRLLRNGVTSSSWIQLMLPGLNHSIISKVLSHHYPARVWLRSRRPRFARSAPLTLEVIVCWTDINHPLHLFSGTPTLLKSLISTPLSGNSAGNLIPISIGCSSTT